MGEAGREIGRGLEPGRLGRYRLLRKIAVGGMAEIYLARVSGPGGFEKDVVVKRILPQLAESDQFYAMFLDEARIAATLQHPNVVQVFDAGQAGGEFFIAMEYLDGADLHTIRRVLQERRLTMPLEHAIFIASAVASGLHYVHERRGLDGRPLDIVHRDVTPQNVFLTREGGVKLVDFGIAKSTNRRTSTSYGTLKGKLAYMSPEQCQSEPVDRRSDIYSLGVLLYELTIGRGPYRGRSEYELLREIVEGDVPPPSRSRPEYPADLEAIAMRALAREAGQRYPSARAMVQDLEAFARRHSLVGSTLALVEFLAPLLDEAQRQTEARHRLRMSSSPALPGQAGRIANEMAHRPPSGRGALGGAQVAARGPGPMAALGLVGHAPAFSAATARAAMPAAARPPGSGAGALAAARSAGSSAGFAAARPVAADRPPGRCAQATPLPERVGPRAPAADAIEADPLVDDVRLRPRRTRQMLLALLLLAAGGAAAALHSRERGARPADEGGGAPVTVPLSAELQVTSDPPGAAVWLSLGPTPAVSGTLDASRGHLIRVEHDGYRPRDVAAEPSDFAPGEPGGAPTAGIAAELEPAGRDEPPPSEPAALPAAEQRPGTAPRVGRLLVTSRPGAAEVWLLVGVTPARIARLATDRPIDLRVARDGYLPAFRTTAPEQLGADGRAHVAIELVPRAPPAAVRRSLARPRGHGPR